MGKAWIGVTEHVCLTLCLRVFPSVLVRGLHAVAPPGKNRKLQAELKQWLRKHIRTLRHVECVQCFQNSQ